MRRKTRFYATPSHLQANMETPPKVLSSNLCDLSAILEKFFRLSRYEPATIVCAVVAINPTNIWEDEGSIQFGLLTQISIPSQLECRFYRQLQV